MSSGSFQNCYQQTIIYKGWYAVKLNQPTNHENTRQL